jgi:hypothetical protein
MMVPPRYAADARQACHERTDCHPVIKERKLRHDLGANRKVQWYCPPAVGALHWSVKAKHDAKMYWGHSH